MVPVSRPCLRQFTRARRAETPAPAAFAGPGDMVLVPTAANGQPAVAEYRRAADNVMRAHSIHVVTGDAARIAAIVVFLDPTLFSAFGLPPTR
jgi:RNA polymerase sigma-70 factor, ECF subfamily